PVRGRVRRHAAAVAAPGSPPGPPATNAPAVGRGRRPGPSPGTRPDIRAWTPWAAPVRPPPAAACQTAVSARGVRSAGPAAGADGPGQAACARDGDAAHGPEG